MPALTVGIQDVGLPDGTVLRAPTDHVRWAPLAGEPITRVVR